MTARADKTASGGATFGLAAETDVPALVAIDSASPQGWTAKAFSAELKNDPPTLFVLRSAGQVLAFVVARLQTPELDIVNLAVARDHRRRGRGRLLLRSLLDHAAPAGVSSVFLEVREGNQEARALYGGFGFRETQRRRGFYREPVEDAILMRLEIEP